MCFFFFSQAGEMEFLTSGYYDIGEILQFDANTQYL